MNWDKDFLGLPLHWQETLKEKFPSVRLEKYRKSFRNGKLPEDGIITAYDFTGNKRTHIKFEDGSRMEFNDCIHLEQDSEVGIFTEHCGYYVVPKVCIESITEKAVRGFDYYPEYQDISKFQKFRVKLSWELWGLYYNLLGLFDHFRG